MKNKIKIITNANGSKEWYLNGKLHRTDGPAIEFADGTKSWYLNGYGVTEEEVIGKKKPADDNKSIKPGCSQCKYSRCNPSNTSNAYPIYRCHKNPPVFPYQSDNVMYIWPQVQPNDWCGGFESQWTLYNLICLRIIKLSTRLRIQLP